MSPSISPSRRAFLKAGAVTAAALDAVPELVRRVIYVDSGPVSDGTIPRPDLSPDTVEIPLPPFPELVAAGSSLAGLSDDYARTEKGDASLDDTAELLIATARVLSEDIAAWQDLYGRKRLTLPA